MMQWKAILAAAALTVAPVALAGGAQAQTAVQTNGYYGYTPDPESTATTQYEAYPDEPYPVQAPPPGYAYNPGDCTAADPYTDANPYCTPYDYNEAYADDWDYPGYGYGWPGSDYYGYYGGAYGYGHGHRNPSHAGYGQGGYAHGYNQSGIATGRGFHGNAATFQRGNVGGGFQGHAMGGFHGGGGGRGGGSHGGGNFHH
jgi:uncharacterized membrane protein YgcG